MENNQLTSKIFYVGVDDKDIDLFEGQYVVPDGISYNSYVIKDEKIAVMDTVDLSKCDEWHTNLETVLSGRTPDYLVVLHMEPDHAGSIESFLNKYPSAKVVSNAKTFAMMPQFFEKRFGDKVMKQFCVFVTFIFLLPYSASVYKGLTSVCSILLGIDEMLCCILIACVAAVLVVLGGYMATLKADFLQGIVMVGGVIALIVVIMRSEQVGGLTDGISNIIDKTSELS
jgi:hypothetical protein